MRKINLFLLFISFAILSKAQQKKSIENSKFSFAAGINLGLPLGDFNLSHTFGLGAELQSEYRINGVTAIYGSVGYTNFFGKKYEFEEPENLNSGLIPIIAGTKIYATQRFFIGAKAGIGIVTGFGSGAGFDYQPQAGFDLQKLQFNLGYNGVTGITGDGGNISNLFLSVLYKF